MTPPVDPALAARTELATPFRYHLMPLAPPQEPWWQRLADAISAFFDRVLARGHLSQSVAVAIDWILFGAAVALTTLLLVRALRGVRRGSRGARRRAETLSNARSEAALAQAAFAAAERGDLVAATRLLMAATVALLGARGAIADDESATIGELRHAVRPLGSAIAMPFDEIASAYVRGVYAQRPVERDTWSRASSAYVVLAAGDA